MQGESCSSLRGSWLNRKELIHHFTKLESSIHHICQAGENPRLWVAKPIIPILQMGNRVPWENPGSESHGCSRVEDWSRLLQFAS